jgi:hypothetical protein
MPAFVCATCATQFTPSDAPPASCPICEDERQYVGWEGQRWTTLEELASRHRPDVRECEPGLLGIGLEPSYGIGQRALLVQTDDGNVLWDCVPLLDDELTGRVERLGGLAAIAISHPHYYTAMVEWSHRFDAPIHLHADDRRWVMRPDPAIRFFTGETADLAGGLTLIRCGGHFAGASVLHWPGGADGRGVLLSGDVITVVFDRRWVSFMYSYPNLVPLDAAGVRRVVAAVEPYAYDRIYGAWWGRVVEADAKAVVARSRDRYLRAIAAE